LFLIPTNNFAKNHDNGIKIVSFAPPPAISGGDDIDVGPDPAGLMLITRIILNIFREIRFS